MRPKFIFRRKIKIFLGKKLQKLYDFFTLNKISSQDFVRFDQFLADDSHFYFIYLEKHEKFKKSIISKKLKMLKVDPKPANLALLQIFGVIEKNGWRIQNQRPKINKVYQYHTKYISAVDQCYKQLM